MANKKIIDYKVVRGDYRFFEVSNNNLFERISDLGKHKNDLIKEKNNINLHKLKIEAVNSILQLKTNKVYPPLNAKEAFRLNHLLEYSTLFKVDKFTISEDSKKNLINLKKSFEDSIIVHKERIEKINTIIENLEMELEVLTEINSKMENSEPFNPVTFQIQQLANEGYVLQGGFYKRDFYGYQAMVKYED